MADKPIAERIKEAELENLTLDIERKKYEKRWAVRSSETLKVFLPLLISISSALIAFDQYKSAKAQKIATQEANDRAAEKSEVIKGYQTELAKEEETNLSQNLSARVPLVYIQFKGSTNRGSINAFREELKLKGYRTPGAERIGKSYKNVVKFFREEDSTSAEKLAIDASEILSTYGEKVNFEVIRHTSSKYSPLEIWIAESFKAE